MFSKLFSDFNDKRNLYFFCVLLAVIWFFCKNIDIFFMVFASIIFACSMQPLVDNLSKKMSRPMAAGVVLTGFILISCIVLLPILALCAYQIGSFATEFPSYIDNLDDTIIHTPFFKTFGLTGVDFSSMMSSFADSTSGIIEGGISFIQGISSAFIYIFTSLIFLFFFLADRDLIRNSIKKIFPKPLREKTDELLTTIMNKLGGYVVAQAVVSGSVWITMTIGLMAFRIEYAMILGLIAGVLSIIPIIGSAISLVICLVATYHAGIVPMVIVTVLFTISHFIENHVVRPYVYSKVLNLHPIIIFLALFIGGKYAGVMGVLFAPPISVALFILLEELYIAKMEK